MEPPAVSKPQEYTFYCSFARLPLITKEVHDVLCFRNPGLQDKLPLEFLDYYVTALLWARLLHIKRHTSLDVLNQLTIEEGEYIRHFLGRLFTLPEPIHEYLMMIGNFTNRLPGLNLYLGDHSLPVSVIKSKNGYHGKKIHEKNHFCFEEIPSLGVSGDCIMRLASNGSRTEPLFPFLPEGTQATLNMVGYFGPASPVTELVQETLNTCSITADQFKEDIKGTRLNIDLIDYVADTVNKLRTFKLFGFSVNNMRIEGSETQLIETHPVSSRDPNSPDQPWTQRSVKPLIYPHNNLGCVRDSYYAGFQLYKEADEGSHLNWCCVKARGSSDVWTVDKEWVYTKNSRRRGVGNLRGICDSGFLNAFSQYDATRGYVQKLITA